jgi:8-oxo-dGTP pyrophosphatase MutT (NUDIX family)
VGRVENDFETIVAALILDEHGRYLMQLRDHAPHIRFHGHWCLFGGMLEAGEEPETGLRRELAEELRFEPGSLTWFAELRFNVPQVGIGERHKIFYEVRTDTVTINRMVLGEGAGMRLFDLGDLLAQPKIVPWDLYALVLHGRTVREPSANLQ